MGLWATGRKTRSEDVLLVWMPLHEPSTADHGREFLQDFVQEAPETWGDCYTEALCPVKSIYSELLGCSDSLTSFMFKLK